MSDPNPTQAANIAQGGDGCCHKTRIARDGCPIGWNCPFERGKASGGAIPTPAAVQDALQQQSANGAHCSGARLAAKYSAACIRFRRACEAVDAAEDERDAARRECARLEREMRIDCD